MKFDFRFRVTGVGSNFERLRSDLQSLIRLVRGRISKSQTGICPGWNCGSGGLERTQCRFYLGDTFVRSSQKRKRLATIDLVD